MSNLAEAPNAGTFATDEDKIVAWRKEELEKAGYNKLHAEQIAERHQGPEAIDLHEAVELVTEKGCDPHIAASIVI